MTIVDENPSDSEEAKHAWRKVLREYWRLMVGAALLAAAPAVLIVALLELGRVDYSGPVGGLGGLFVRFSPEGKLVAVVQQWKPEDPDSVGWKGEFDFDVRGERRGGGFLILPQTSTRHNSTTLTITKITGMWSPTTLSDSEIPNDSPYRLAVDDLIRREGSKVTQRAWFDGVPFTERHYVSAFFNVFLVICWPLCVLAVGLPGIIKLGRRVHRVARGECSGCGYDLSGSQGMTRCPECGTLVA